MSDEKDLKATDLTLYGGCVLHRDGRVLIKQNEDDNPGELQRVVDSWNAYDLLKSENARLRAALEKIAAYGSDEAEPGTNLTGWQILTLNPQAAVEIAKDALSTDRKGGEERAICQVRNSIRKNEAETT